MVQTVIIRRIGGALGVTLPEDLLKRHGLGEGSKVHVVETPYGLLLSNTDPHFVDAMKAYEEAAKQYENALRELARS